VVKWLVLKHYALGLNLMASEDKQQIKVAAYQAAPKSTFENRKQQIFNALNKADRDNIDFICFPECFFTGYYAEEKLARENSIDLKSDDFQNWLSDIRHFHSTIILGLIERDGSDIFDSVAIIEKGKLLGIQRKHYLYHHYFTPGNAFVPFFSKGICFGVIICLDTVYFEPARLLALQGAAVLFSPMCNKVSLDHPFAKRPVYYSHFVARSFENRCWLITADWVWQNDGNMSCPGHTIIYDPDGQEITRSQEGKEEWLIVNIPKNRLFQEKGRRIHGSITLAQEIQKLIQKVSSSV
jgi:N-carbamoylputrescine amidase